MLEELEDFLNKHQWLVLFLILFIVALMFLGIGSVMLENVEKAKLRKEYLMSECLKDRKEYECEALLKDNQDFDIIIQGF